MDIKKIDIVKAKSSIETQWDNEIKPSLCDFIRIPNLSKEFDEQWNTNGLLPKAAQHIFDWAKKQNLKGFKGEILKDKDHSPLVFIEIDGSSPQSISALFYGHFDKQPHGLGWREGLSPIIPVIENNKLFGRGSLDDGYSIYAIISSIKLCQEQGLPHPRCLITIEGNEESNEEDYMFYLEILKPRLGDIKLVFAVDSLGLSFDSFWISTSLRGVLMAKLTVKVLQEGVHSGDASGIVPSSFRIIRTLLDRIENSQTGEIHQAFQVIIPGDRYAESIKTAQQFPKLILEKYPLVPGMNLVTNMSEFAFINQTWKPTLCVTGMDGLPETAVAGNVLRSSTTLKLSLRMPPSLDYKFAAKQFKEILEKDPPYGAQVTCDLIDSCPGWVSKSISQQLKDSINQSSINFFGKESFGMGQGGSIPLMYMINNLFPDAQFIVCGIGGPDSNAHGPNENLDIPALKNIIGCLAQIISENNQ